MTYPGSAHIANLPEELPLKVGDTWQESGEDGDRIFTWHLAIAMRPKLWMFNSVGPLGHDRDGNGGMEGRSRSNTSSPDRARRSRCSPAR
jgi:hypothetical protein